MKQMKQHQLIHVISMLIVGILASCTTTPQPNTELFEPGVSKALAEFRKEHFTQLIYDLCFFIPESEQEEITGNNRITFTLTESQPIILDFKVKPEQIKSVSLNNQSVPYQLENEHIVIDKQYVKPGENEVFISFIVDDQSLNRRDDLIYTLLVPDRARSLFPCFDQPDMKASFGLVLEYPASWEAVTNSPMRLLYTITEKDKKLVLFNYTEPISTYLFSFVAGKLKREVYNHNDREISLYHRETDPRKVAQCPEIASEVFDALDWMEAYTAVPYPFTKYDLIILPGFQYGGMEHTGATLYTDRRMFLNEHPTLNEQLSRSALIAHETAHMWFGDYVTMKWFDDVWTKEVFANYFASQIVEPLYPEVNHRLNFMLDYIPSAYSEDRTAGTNPIKQELDNLCNAGLVYGNIIYTKSPVMMEMLVKRIGKEAFQQGIREYLKTYAYGNADWDGLIGILDKYTDEDLLSWSKIWVNEKGMPEISATVKNDSLIVTQRDPFGRGLHWPQDVSYRVISGKDSEEITVSLDSGSDSFRKKLNFQSEDSCLILPDTDGQGYGFFKLNEADARYCMAVLDSATDEVLRGSLLVNLYENMLNQTLSSEWYINSMLKYLPKETNSLLFSAALGYVNGCQRLYPVDTLRIEKALWRLVNTATTPQHRLQTFRTYRNIASSPKAIEQLYSLWKKKQAPAGCALSENDYISLSWLLALRLPERADEIVTLQQSRITNPDRKREYAFIAPSVSPRKAERDSVFASLLLAENRSVEPWVSAALANLNHSSRQSEAIAYIRPALDALQDVQHTGDIFFPSAWLRGLLAGHTSVAARDEVDRFFTDNPDYPGMLSNKIRQQADYLYRRK